MPCPYHYCAMLYRHDDSRGDSRSASSRTSRGLTRGSLLRSGGPAARIAQHRCRSPRRRSNGPDRAGPRRASRVGADRRSGGRVRSRTLWCALQAASGDLQGWGFRHDAPCRFPAARRANFRSADREWRGARCHSQRAARCGCARGSARIRRRQRRDWRVDRSALNCALNKSVLVAFAVRVRAIAGLRNPTSPADAVTRPNQKAA